ncbi:MAG TPA: hypothetical protein VEB21_01285 [Terriglobales bacterium]|nr:hypothetical protein [Terriglobales bacterium]
MVSSPIEIVIQIFQTVWSVYIAGALRAIPKIAGWIGNGSWYVVTMKVGVVLLCMVMAKSMWTRLADVGDTSPMMPVIATALILGGSIAGLVAFATGYWGGFDLPF